MDNILQKKTEVPGIPLAITAESLYLINLLLLPGLAFLVQIWFFLKYENRSPVLAGCHLRQTFSASIWAGLLLLLVNWVIVAVGSSDNPYTWVIVALYFIVCHSALVILGIFGLARAMAGRMFHYPIIGPSN